MGDIQFKSENLTPTNDGQRFSLGKTHLELIHTPGHTLESVCYKLENNLFTGDTLFLGDVGRVDLSQASSSNELAEKMYETV